MGEQVGWMAAMAKARAACDAAGYAEDARSRQLYSYQVDFTISSELVDLKRFEAAKNSTGVRFHIEFVGGLDAKERVLGVIEQLPSVSRSYRMNYEQVQAGERDG